LPALALAFSLGVIAVSRLPALPPAAWTLSGLVALPLLVRGPRAARWCAAALLGFCYAWGIAAHELSERLPDRLDGTSFTVTGCIDSLPEVAGRSARFDLRVASLTGPAGVVSGPDRIRLSWYDDIPDLHAGQRWHLSVKLHAPHGYANPGGFDYERWLFGRGIDATGYVADETTPRRLESDTRRLARWRERVSGAIAERTGPGPGTALLRALAVGDRRGLDDSMWSALNATGTSHLVAISGLHIGLVAALGMVLGRGLARRSRILLWVRPSSHWGAVLAIGLATGYAALAGFALPTRRALAMVAVVLGAVWLRRAIRPHAALAAACLVVVLLDPLAPLDTGFWLSFLAVAALAFAFVGRRRRRYADAARAQWVVALGLLPALALAFGRLAWIAPMVNLAAIPVVGLLAVPLALAGTALLGVPGPLTGWLLSAAAWLLGGFWAAVKWLAAWPLLTLSLPVPAPWALPAALVGVAWLLGPGGLPGRRLGALLLVPLLFPGGATPESGSFRLAVLDVGQGLSAVIRTKGHALVYDTGPVFRSGFNTAHAVVAPYLRATGIGRLDALVISHGDSDHAGGAAWLARRFHAAHWLSGDPGLDPAAEPCLQGQSWRWDGVTFRILHPPPGMPYLGNASSCVLRVSGFGGSVLLSGDIPRVVEHRLVNVLGARLASDVLVAPHHGSAGSSSAAFIRAVAPKVVVYSAGYHNRFGLPAPEVVTRYESLGVQSINTAACGMARFDLSPGKASLGAYCWRRRNTHAWTHQPELAASRRQRAKRPGSQ